VQEILLHRLDLYFTAYLYIPYCETYRRKLFYRHCSDEPNLTITTVNIERTIDPFDQPNPFLPRVDIIIYVVVVVISRTSAAGYNEGACAPSGAWGGLGPTAAHISAVVKGDGTGPVQVADVYTHTCTSGGGCGGRRGAIWRRRRRDANPRQFH